MFVMNEKILQYVKMISDEKKIPQDTVMDALKGAIIKAYEKVYPEEVLSIDIDIDKNIFSVNKVFNIVEKSDDLNDYVEMTVEDANDYYKKNKIDKKAKIGDVLLQELDFSTLSKKAVDQIIQIFKQTITIKGNIEIFNKWKDHIGENIYAEIEKNDKHGIYVHIENEEYGYMSLKDAIPNEKLLPGHKYYFNIKSVKQQSSGWPIILSRTNEGLIKNLLKNNIPEIQEGIVDIVDVARVPGFKTKIAVISHQPGVDPCGTIIGPHGTRIFPITKLINREKIEVVEHSDDIQKYIIDVCSPAAISGYKILKKRENDNDLLRLILIIDASQLPLLLGKKGSNIRIISKLLKADIDVMTIEDARHDNIEYTSVEVKSSRQRTFDRILSNNKSKNVSDLIAQFDSSSGYKKVMDDLKSNNILIKTKKEKPIELKAENKNKNETVSDESSKNNEDALKKSSSHQQSISDIVGNLRVDNNENINKLDLELEQNVVGNNKYHKKPKKSFKNKKHNDNFSQEKSKEDSILNEISGSNAEEMIKDLVKENESRQDEEQESDDDYGYNDNM